MLANSFPTMILINMLQGSPLVKHIEDPSTKHFFLGNWKEKKITGRHGPWVAPNCNFILDIML